MNFLSEQAQESALIGPEWGLWRTLFRQSRCSAIVLCVCLLTDVLSVLRRDGKWANEQLTSFLMGRSSALNAEVVLLRLQTGEMTRSLPVGWGINQEKLELLNYAHSKLPQSRIKLWKRYSTTVWLAQMTSTVDKQASLLWTGGEEIFSILSKPFTWESPSLKDSLRLPGRLIPRGEGQRRSHIHQLFKNKEDNNR